MDKYCLTYFVASGKINLESFLEGINIKPNKIIIKEDNTYEIHFCYFDKYDGDLEKMYYETIRDLIPYLDYLVSWIDKGICYKLEVKTNIEEIEKFTVVRFEIAHFVHYTKAYNNEYHIW